GTGVTRGAGGHLVHDVGPAHAGVEVGEAERPAPPAVAEGTGVRAEGEFSAGQHEAETPAHLEPEDEVFGVALLLDRLRDRPLAEQTDATEPAAARERRHDPRDRTGVPMSVRGGALRAPPFGPVRNPGSERGVVQRPGGDRLRVDAFGWIGCA